MIRQFLLGVFLLSSCHSFAQEVTEKSDESAMKYLEIGKEYYLTIGSPDSLIKYADRALVFAEAAGDSKSKCLALTYLGVGNLANNEYTKAKNFYFSALRIAEEIEDQSQQASLHNKLGALYSNIDKSDSSVIHLIEAANLFKEIDDYNSLAYAYYGIAFNYAIAEQDDKTLDYLQQALDLTDSITDDKITIREIIFSFAAQHYLELAKEEEEYKEQARSYAEKGLAIADNQQMFSRKPTYYNVYSGYHLLKNEPEKAQYYSLKTLSIPNLREDQRYKAYLHLAASLAATGKPTKALSYLDSAGQLSSMQANYYKHQLEEERYKILKSTGRFEEAMISLEKMSDYQKALTDVERDKIINELETAYETTQKQNEIDLLQNQVAVQEALNSRQNWIIGSGILVAILILVSSWLYYQRRISGEKEQSAIHKQQLLRSQINPHFIFNSLSSIRGFLFDGNDTKPAITYLGKFAKLMRMVLELSSKEWVSLSDEVRALELYLEIQQIRFNKAFDFDLSIDPSIDANEIMVPPLTAQPFIENAIEHGLKGIKKDGKVEVACQREQGKLIFKIQDNGIGIDHVEPRKNHQSRAIQIFRERLGIIGKRMKMSFSFDISDIGDSNETHGTLVMYELPLVKA